MAKFKLFLQKLSRDVTEACIPVLISVLGYKVCVPSENMVLVLSTGGLSSCRCPVVTG